MVSLLDFSTKVPDSWIFSHYLEIPIEKFNGGTIKVSSPFNSDTNFSLYLNYSNISKDYMFKDFSSGYGGNGLKFVNYLLNYKHNKVYSIGEIKLIVAEEYSKFKGEYTNNINPNLVKKTKITNVINRDWNKNDKLFWGQYGITFEHLQFYNVKPVFRYTFDFSYKKQDFTGENIYGYYKSDGSLYKLYLPFGNSKFITIDPTYIQGTEQCSGKDYLIYQKSLKDCICLHSFGLNVDVKACNSENTLIPENIVKEDLKKYKKILIWYDPDKPGIEAAHKVEKLYGIKSMFLNYGTKDLSDHIKMFGVKKVKYWTITTINKKLNE